MEDSIKKICDASIDIKNCIENDEYLCNRLNSIDKNLIREYYKNNKSGVVIDIRKEVCKILLLDDIDLDKLHEIIRHHKENEPQKLRSWVNPYKILHPLINISYSDLDDFVEIFIKELIEKIGDVKYTVCNFNGSQHQGSDEYWIAFYNKKHRSQSDGIQLYLSIRDGVLKYGIYNHRDKTYLSDPVEFISFDLLCKFAYENKNQILDEVVDLGMTFIDAGKYILEEFGNKPMSGREIWSEIDKRNLVRTGGRTPWASMNTILLNDSVDSPVNMNRSRNIFKIVGKNPVKFILNNYMNKNIKDIMIQNGFITIDVLREIFEKNGLEFKI